MIHGSNMIHNVVMLYILKKVENIALPVPLIIIHLHGSNLLLEI